MKKELKKLLLILLVYIILLFIVKQKMLYDNRKEFTEVKETCIDSLKAEKERIFNKKEHIINMDCL